MTQNKRETKRWVVWRLLSRPQLLILINMKSDWLHIYSFFKAGLLGMECFILEANK